MTRENLALGSSANDGTGDTLRAAGTKINNNFVELYRAFGIDSDNLSLNVTLDSDHVVFAGASYSTSLGITAPTANRSVDLPDAAGTVVLDTATQTLTNKTLKLPSINDSNNNELIKFTTTSSAINEFTIANAASGGKPTLTSTGGGTNITMKLAGKGTGSVEVAKAAYSAVTITSNGTASEIASYIICNKASALAVVLSDGTTDGEYKIFTNKGGGTATVTPDNFSAGTSFALPQHTGAQTIWDGTNWYLIGADSDVTVS